MVYSTMTEIAKAAGAVAGFMYRVAVTLALLFGVPWLALQAADAVLGIFGMSCN